MRRVAVTVALALVACGGGKSTDSGASSDAVDFEGDDPGECRDDADNDRDGLFDCDDPDCAGSEACGGAGGGGTGGGGGGTGTGGTGTGTATGSTAPCENALLDVHPADGAGGAYPRTAVAFDLTFHEPDATITLTTGDGAPVAGELTVDRARVRFEPTDGLDPGEEYVAHLEWSCPTVTSRWTVTPDVGDPVVPHDLQDRTYAAPLDGGRFVDPPPVLMDLGIELLEQTALLQVLAADDRGIQGRLGSGDADAEQNRCQPTTDPGPGEFDDNPYFQLSGVDLQVHLDDAYATRLLDATVAGAFTADGAAITGLSVTGSLDTVPMIEYVSPGGEDDAVCVLMSTFSAECHVCPDGSSPYCLDYFVEDLTAEWVPGLEVVPRTPDDIARDPECP